MRGSLLKTLRCSSALTLVELLVVIAIVAILAALIYPAISKMRASAHRTECVSNQRELAQLYLQLVNDNNGYFIPALAQRLRGGRETKWSGLHWHRALDQYIKGEDSTDLLNYLVCPATEGEVDMRSPEGGLVRTTYGLNNYLGAHHANGTPIGAPMLVRLAKPSETVLFGDPKFAGEQRITQLNIHSDGTENNIAVRHGDKAVIAFADGHAETVDPTNPEEVPDWGPGVEEGTEGSIFWLGF